METHNVTENKTHNQAGQDMVAHTYKHLGDRGSSRIKEQGYPQLHSEFKASLIHKTRSRPVRAQVRPCLKGGGGGT